MGKSPISTSVNLFKLKKRGKFIPYVHVNNIKSMQCRRSIILFNLKKCSDKEGKGMRIIKKNLPMGKWVSFLNSND